MPKALLHVALGCLLFQSARAAMYLQDPFNYTAATQLGANSPWASPYAQVTVASGSLTYPSLADIAPVGNMVAAVAASGGGSSFGVLDTTATSGAVYYSFLAKAATAPGTAGYYITGLLPSTTTTPGGRTVDPIVLMAKSATGGFILGVGSANASAAVYATNVLTANITNLVVLKYDLSSKVASLFLNPSPGGTEPGTPDATVTGTTPFSDIKHVYFRTPSGSGTWNFDTLRIASTWAEATPMAALPPTISPAGQPQSQTVETGATVTFSVVSTGSLPMSYQWYFNTNTLMPDRTNATLLLTGVTTNDAGSYHVVVTNDYGTNISAFATLAVTPPAAPSIVNDPASQSVIEGSLASLSVTAAGSVPLTYQWLKGGATILDATNDVYSISSVTTNDAGDYQVVVTNVYGSVTSAVGTLIVSLNTQPPAISSQPVSQTVQPGANVSFNVVASGAAPLSYQWFFNLTNAIADATNSAVNLNSVSISNDGDYHVILTNAYGSATSAVATLTISTNATPVNPNDFINPRFANVTVTSGVQFGQVLDYKGILTTLYLDVYQPTGDTSTNRPVIMWIHGGGLRTGSSRTQGYIVTYATDFAKRGYVCMSIDYRLRSGADMPTTASELPALQDAASDANTALAWIRAHASTYGINSNWLFVAGGSAGGMIGSCVCFVDGTNAPSLPGMVFDQSGVIALGDLWGSPELEKRWYEQPPHSLNSNDIPTCIVHGTADTTVPYSNSVALYQSLTNVGVAVELHPLVGYGHTPIGSSTDPLIEGWLANFFAQEWTKVLSPVPPAPTSPTAATQLASVLLPNGATLNATINPGGAATAWYFQYGLTTAYGSYSDTNALPAGTSPVAVNSAIRGLFSGMPYHYQVVAVNSAGTSTGADLVFDTVAVTSPQFGGVAVNSAGAFQCAFTSTPGASFTVLFTTNLALSVSDWTVIGLATEGPAGQYQFSDPQATNSTQRFYQLRSP
jgi:acetyl esterase/lipase